MAVEARPSAAPASAAEKMDARIVFMLPLLRGDVAAAPIALNYLRGNAGVRPEVILYGTISV